LTNRNLDDQSGQDLKTNLARLMEVRSTLTKNFRRRFVYGLGIAQNSNNEKPAILEGPSDKDSDKNERLTFGKYMDYPDETIDVQDQIIRAQMLYFKSRLDEIQKDHGEALGRLQESSERRDNAYEKHIRVVEEETEAYRWAFNQAIQRYEALKKFYDTLNAWRSQCVINQERKGRKETVFPHFHLIKDSEHQILSLNRE